MTNKARIKIIAERLKRVMNTDESEMFYGVFLDDLKLLLNLILEADDE